MTLAELKEQLSEVESEWRDKAEALSPGAEDFDTAVDAVAKLDDKREQIATAISMREKANDLGERVASVNTDSVKIAGDWLDEAYDKHNLADKARDGVDLHKLTIPVGSIDKMRHQAIARKKTTVTTTVSGGSMDVVRDLPDIVDVGYRQTRIRDLSGVVTLTGERAVSYLRVTSFTNSANIAAENTEKLESAIAFAEESESVKTIAHTLPVTRQALRSRSQLQRLVERRLLLGLLVKEDQQLLYGVGGGTEVQGILEDSSINTRSWSAGVTGDNQADAILRGAVDIWDATAGEVAPNAVILSVADWANLVLSKDTTNGYIFPPEFRQNLVGGPPLYGLQWVVTPAIATGTALVGAFGIGNQVYEEEAAILRMTESHASEFTSNVVRLLAEESILQTVEIPDAFCEVTLDNAPA